VLKKWFKEPGRLSAFGIWIAAKIIDIFKKEEFQHE